MTRSEEEYFTALIGDRISDGGARREAAKKSIAAVGERLTASGLKGIRVQTSDASVQVFVGEYSFGLKVENQKPVLYRLTFDVFREHITQRVALPLDLGFDGARWQSAKPSTYITPIPGEPIPYQTAEAAILQAIYTEITKDSLSLAE